MPTPNRDNGYQIADPSGIDFTADLWNAIFADIHARLLAREGLEASFEALEAQGVQASLDYIQATVAPQLEDLQSGVQQAQAQIDQIVIDGISPDAAKLGGKLPDSYASAQALSNGLAGRVPTSRTLNGKPLSTDVTLGKADIGLGRVDNTRDADKPVSADQRQRLGVPIGAEIFWSGSAIPYGYLEENRAELLRANYPELWAHAQASGMLDPGGADVGMFSPGNGSTTFRLPDARGEILRGWDHGRGVDAGRALGSSQGDAMRRLTDSFTTYYAQESAPSGELFVGSGGNEKGPAMAGTGYQVAGLSFDNARITPTAAENRPRNIARMVLIKAYF
ncbi:hypothetical protein [Palleronia sp.]|uniref:hypothetical protein n=1 Tax=Palleronia sp. TaxID=1940284 RepID=UPI0035C8781A